MPHHVLPLPGDRLGVFSTVVDAFLVVGNPDEVSATLRDLGYHATAIAAKLSAAASPDTFTLEDALLSLSVNRSPCNYREHVLALGLSAEQNEWAARLYLAAQEAGADQRF